MSEEGYLASHHGSDVEDAWPQPGSCPDDDVDEEEDGGRPSLTMTRGRAFRAAVAGKEPWAPVAYEEPDLAEYFSAFEGLSEASQVAICRTFANYLAAKQRREPVKRRRRAAPPAYED